MNLNRKVIYGFLATCMLAGFTNSSMCMLGKNAIDGKAVSGICAQNGVKPVLNANIVNTGKKSGILQSISGYLPKAEFYKNRTLLVSCGVIGAIFATAFIFRKSLSKSYYNLFGGTDFENLKKACQMGCYHWAQRIIEKNKEAIENGKIVITESDACVCLKAAIKNGPKLAKLIIDKFICSKEKNCLEVLDKDKQADENDIKDDKLRDELFCATTEFNGKKEEIEELLNLVCSNFFKFSAEEEGKEKKIYDFNSFLYRESFDQAAKNSFGEFDFIEWISKNTNYVENFNRGKEAVEHGLINVLRYFIKKQKFDTPEEKQELEEIAGYCLKLFADEDEDFNPEVAAQIFSRCQAVFDKEEEQKFYKNLIEFINDKSQDVKNLNEVRQYVIEVAGYAIRYNKNGFLEAIFKKSYVKERAIIFAEALSLKNREVIELLAKVSRSLARMRFRGSKKKSNESKEISFIFCKKDIDEATFDSFKSIFNEFESKVTFGKHNKEDQYSKKKKVNATDKEQQKKEFDRPFMKFNLEQILA